MPLEGINSLSADALNQLEPHRMNNWTLEIPDLDPTSGADLILGLQAFQLPTETSELLEIYYLNERRQYAGRTNYDGGSLSLTDWIDQGTAEAIRKWRKLVYDPETGRIGVKGEYAKQGNLYLYTPGTPGTTEGNNPKATRQWRLMNIWPISVAWGPLDMASTEKIQIEVQMVYDKAMPFPRKSTFKPTPIKDIRGLPAPPS